MRSGHHCDRDRDHLFKKPCDRDQIAIAIADRRAHLRSCPTLTRTGKKLVLKIDMCSLDTHVMAFIMFCAVQKPITRVPAKPVYVQSATNKWISTTSSTALKIICHLPKLPSGSNSYVYIFPFVQFLYILCL